MCLLIICLLLLASQHLPLSCFYSDFFLHTQTHNHAQMFINDVQDIPAAVNQPLRNLLYVKKPWQLFSSISHTHTHTYTWKETHRISIFSLFEDSLLSRIWQAASLSIQPPAKPGLLINTSQCKQDKPAALPVAHLSESPAETNAESRRMHVNPRMLMLEVNPNWQRDKFACLAEICSLSSDSRLRSPFGNKSSHSPMCCPEGEGGGFRRGRVRWVEVGEAGDVVYHRGERGCDCSRQSNYCHALSMRNIKRESESESKRLWGTPPPPPPCMQFPLPCPIRSLCLQGLGGGQGYDWMEAGWV